MGGCNGERETRGAKGDDGSAGKERKQAVLRTVKAAVPVKPVSSCDTMHPGESCACGTAGQTKARRGWETRSRSAPSSLSPATSLSSAALTSCLDLPRLLTTLPAPLDLLWFVFRPDVQVLFLKFCTPCLSPMPWLTITFEITSTFLTTQSWPLSHPSPLPLKSPPPPSAPD